DIEASKSNVNVYPNPSSNSIMVSGIDTKSLNAVVSLFDMEGKIISKEKLPMQGDNLQFSVSDITPGSYLMMIQDDKGNFIHRQIIVKIK
ncbi:MAG: T9SS type A sorting domain-containing protein, partial [Bacteroidia bacterium]